MFLFLTTGVAAQILHNIADPLHSLHGAVDQRVHILDDVIYLQFFTQLAQEFLIPTVMIHCGDIFDKTDAVAPEGKHVTHNKTDGVVQLMGHPCHQTT